jgi:hypothetical protein
MTNSLREEIADAIYQETTEGNTLSTCTEISNTILKLIEKRIDEYTKLVNELDIRISNKNVMLATIENIKEILK